jgi:ornithine decarboxylase
MNIYTTSFGINIALHNYTTLNTKTRWIYDKTALLKQANKWALQIPWIKPYYAVKSNPLSYMIDDLTNYKLINIGLDVSSIKETNMALKYTTLKNTIYTNPHTIPHEINKSLFNLKIVDSICELELLHKNDIHCPILIRINSGIKDANINFDSKFGATKKEAYDIINLANEYHYIIKGVSFHIGSGGNFSRKDAFQQAYINVKPILNYIQIFNKQKLILNIGGGFLYNTDLTEALGWTKDLPYTIIAEPGRYFSEPSHHLAIQVIAITPKGIFLDNGVYHELNCFHRDHWTMPKLTHCIENNKIKEIHNYKSNIIFGPTCDSYDTIGRNKLPNDIQVGDWILLPNMGAYTNAGVVDFNGIQSASSI